MLASRCDWRVKAVNSPAAKVSANQPVSMSSKRAFWSGSATAAAPNTVAAGGAALTSPATCPTLPRAAAASLIAPAVGAVAAAAAPAAAAATSTHVSSSAPGPLQQPPGPTRSPITTPIPAPQPRWNADCGLIRLILIPSL